MRRYQIEARERIEMFAELLSDNLSVTAAARLMGISRNRANKYLARIRAELGAQAV